MGYRLRRFVRSVLDNLQILTGCMDALVVAAVDEHVGTEKRMEKGAGFVVGRMESIFSRYLMQTRMGHFSDSPVKIEIDKLHSLADSKDRFVHPVKQMQGVKLFQSELQFRNGSDMTVIFFRAGRGTSEKGRVAGEGGEHIAAAGQKQPVKGFRMLFQVGCVRKDDCTAGSFFQGSLIVFVQHGRTDDGNFFHGRIRSFDASVILLYAVRRGNVWKGPQRYISLRADGSFAEAMTGLCADDLRNLIARVGDSFPEDFVVQVSVSLDICFLFLQVHFRGHAFDRV